MPSNSQKVPALSGGRIGRRLDPGSLLEIPGEKIELNPASSTQNSDGRGSIGQVIRKIRKEKGISQEELAKKARVDRTTIARVECGIFKSLSVEKLEGIAGVLGIDLKTILFQSESLDQTQTPAYRGGLSRPQFTLEYPEEGFRLTSLIPKRSEFFFGKIEIQPQKTILTSRLPHPEQIYLHVLEGKMLLMLKAKEFLFKPGDCFVFSGFHPYEFYNPDPFKAASSLFITYPSFL